MSGHIQLAGSVNWDTPQWIVEKVTKCFGGLIDLDPCGSDTSIVDAETTYVLPKSSPRPFPENPVSGLDRSWHIKDSTRVYCNPPFGKTYANKDYTDLIGAKEHSDLMKMSAKGDETARAKLETYINKYSIKDWIKKAALEANQFGSEIILLTPASTDVSYFQDIIFKQTGGVCFVKGRVRYLVDKKETGPAPHASAISYFGTHFAHFKEAFEPHGKVIRL